MKKCILITIIVALGLLRSQAQLGEYREIYLGTGFSVGWSSFDQMNAMLDLYDMQNEQESSFKPIDFPRGFEAVAGINISILNFELGYTQVQQRRYTQYNDGGNLLQRDVRFRMGSWFLGTGLFFPMSDNFGYGVNVRGDYNRFTLGTRFGDDNNIGGDSYLMPSRSDSFGFTVDMRFCLGQMDYSGTRFVIKPYYSVVFDDFDFSETTDLVNGEGASDSLDTMQNLSNFGIKFIIYYSARY